MSLARLLVASSFACAACAASHPAPLAAPPTLHVEPTVLDARQTARDAELVPQAKTVIDAYANSNSKLTRAGEVVYVSTRDVVPRLFVADAADPTSAARPLATGDERVAGITLTADERSLYFTSDKGADANFHISRIGLDGSGLVDLTPGEKLHRGQPIVARQLNGRFAYGAHGTGDETLRLFVQDADGPPIQVFADRRGGALEDFSSDGTHLLYLRINSDDDQIVFDLDTTTGVVRRVFPPLRQKAVVTAAQYTADGQRVLVAIEAADAPPRLLLLDPANGNILEQYVESALPRGFIASLRVSPAGDRLAIVVNGGNHSEARILGAHLLALERTLTTPVGLVALGEFTRDGRRMTLVQSTPNAPPDLFVADVSTGALTPLRQETRAGLDRLPPLTSQIVQVPAFDGLSLPINLYLPQTQGRHATIVLVHGGPTSSAFAAWSPEVRFWTALGYVVIAPNIRGSSGFGVAFQRADDKDKRAGALADVETINRWARAQPWCDGNLIIMGTSYGGYMTLLALGRQPQLWRAGVDLSGMSNLRTMEQLEDQAIRVVDETEFGRLGKEDKLLLKWSPLRYANRIVAPLFVYQGHNDPVTPQYEAEQIVDVLRKRKVRVEYMLVANEGHGIVRRDNRITYLSRAARFLEDVLAGR